MKILITLGATREPIDAVRFIGNRSSGKMGAALVSAATAQGHTVTVIAAAISASLPALAMPNRRVDVETAQQMHDAVLAEFPTQDLLIMAAAVADFRPVRIEQGKLPRSQSITIACEPTADILAALASAKRPHQRIVGFSLEQEGNIERARQKMMAKHVDLMVFNSIKTMGSAEVDATLLWPDGRSESLGMTAKEQMAARLLKRALELF